MSIQLQKMTATNNHQSSSCTNNNNNNNNLKRKAYDRLAESNTSSSSNSKSNTKNRTKLSGRGCLVGWTSCPLCGRHSTKRFALGRGIASHLYAVHTPWNPGKVEYKKRRRLEERKRSEQRRKQQQKQQSQLQIEQNNNNNNPVDGDKGDEQLPPRCSQNEEEQDNHPFTQIRTWQPTPQEVEDWDARVLEIVKELEAKQEAALANVQELSSTESSSLPPLPPPVAAGLERNGQPSTSYRDSLPPFLQAAANGDLTKLQQFVDEAKHNKVKSESCCIKQLLDTRDRHLSTAEHWAAGGGHVDCLRFLLQLRREHDSKVVVIDGGGVGKSNIRHIRRRDGKTCLHYAARYGQLSCVQYLLDDMGHAVDEASGDGTTPLHLACYGLHLQVVRLLVDRGANIKATNEWGCSAAHWIAMAATTSTSSSSPPPTTTTASCESTPASSTVAQQQVRDLANFLKSRGVSFVEGQKQGHTALHKAAQRQNRHLLEWLADKSVATGGAGLSLKDLTLGALPDDGGHTPSDIWKSVGGDSAFAQWMEQQGW